MTTAQDLKGLLEAPEDDYMSPIVFCTTKTGQCLWALVYRMWRERKELARANKTLSEGSITAREEYRTHVDFLTGEITRLEAELELARRRKT